MLFLMPISDTPDTWPLPTRVSERYLIRVSADTSIHTVQLCFAGVASNRVDVDKVLWEKKQDRKYNLTLSGAYLHKVIRHMCTGNYGPSPTKPAASVSAIWCCAEAGKGACPSFVYPCCTGLIVWTFALKLGRVHVLLSSIPVARG